MASSSQLVYSDLQANIFLNFLSAMPKHPQYVYTNTHTLLVSLLCRNLTNTQTQQNRATQIIRRCGMAVGVKETRQILHEVSTRDIVRLKSHFKDRVVILHISTDLIPLLLSKYSCTKAFSVIYCSLILLANGILP